MSAETDPPAGEPGRSRLRRLGGRGRRRWALLALGGLITLFALIQAVPYGRDHSNPPVTAGPTWDSSRTKQLLADACGDCHSNLTRWPWYTNVAPFSWLAQKDVDEGREAVNLSELGRTEVEIEEMAEVIRSGEMPPWQYRVLHGAARLSDQEKEALIAGLAASLAGVAGSEGEGEED